MSMTPRERIMAVYSGEEPDKTPIIVPGGLLNRQPPGDWEDRLRRRGIGFMGAVGLFTPALNTWGEPLPPPFPGHGLPLFRGCVSPPC